MDTKNMADLLRALPYFILDERPYDGSVSMGSISQINTLLELLPMVRNIYHTAYYEAQDQAWRQAGPQIDELTKGLQDMHKKLSCAERNTCLVNQALLEERQNTKQLTKQVRVEQAKYRGLDKDMTGEMNMLAQARHDLEVQALNHELEIGNLKAEIAKANADRHPGRSLLTLTGWGRFLACLGK